MPTYGSLSDFLKNGEGRAQSQSRRYNTQSKLFWAAAHFIFRTDVLAND
jgi:hypothetical protein